jgi:parvulin-like peptidyl-prolyl isomerase
VVETPFGYHVIMLVEVTPAHRLSKAERLDALRAEILRVRGLRAKRALLEKLKADTKIDIASNQDALLGQIEVVPSAAGSTGDPSGGSE